jgi:hypothetical protein
MNDTCLICGQSITHRHTWSGLCNFCQATIEAFLPVVKNELEHRMKPVCGEEKFREIFERVTKVKLDLSYPYFIEFPAETSDFMCLLQKEFPGGKIHVRPADDGWLVYNWHSWYFYFDGGQYHIFDSTVYGGTDGRGGDMADDDSLSLVTRFKSWLNSNPQWVKTQSPKAITPEEIKDADALAMKGQNDD